MAVTSTRRWDTGASAPASTKNGRCCCTRRSSRTLLEVHHFAADDITHLTVYVVGPRANLVQAWGAVERWFPQAVPPATLLGVSLLGHAGQLVEVDATIVRDDGVRG